MPDPPSAGLPFSSTSVAHASSFQYLRKQAKVLLHDYHAGDAFALTRISAVCPHLRGKWHGVPRAQVGLAEAQFTLARELGFSSWARLKQSLAAANPKPTLAPKSQKESRIMTTQSPTSLGLSAIDQIGMSCTDLAEAQRFYCEILGLRYGGEVPGMSKFFDCNGVNLIMFKADKVGPASVIYFKVEGIAGKIQEKVELLRKLGVEIHQDARRIAENWKGYDVYLAFFKDPFGNLLSLKSDVPVK
jgi:catechol 2,3-dioxygenase-like lactoylglutathione lyase family enzyme